VPRVAGIDPGTVSIDLCGLDNGRVWLDRTFPTREALRDPTALVAILTSGGRPDLIAGPSGYGLPLLRADQATETDLKLALLAPDDGEGGIGGLGALMRSLGSSGLPVVYTPGVVHLPSVPSYRKQNRIDLGTADKVAIAALGIRDQSERRGCSVDETSFILLELGGAFTAALAVDRGAIVDGIGGTSGPIGWQSSGGWDGEVALLAGRVTKGMLFRGGQTGEPTLSIDGYIEAAHKAVLSLLASLPAPREIMVSGRHAHDSEVRPGLEARLSALAPVHDLAGFAKTAKQGAQGAALIADGLAGGEHRRLIETMRIHEAAGTALDYLRVITPADARRQLGID
jgi:predicted butyrate kinase (DUF1464 family)